MLLRRINRFHHYPSVPSILFLISASSSQATSLPSLGGRLISPCAGLKGQTRMPARKYLNASTAAAGLFKERNLPHWGISQSPISDIKNRFHLWAGSAAISKGGGRKINIDIA